MRWSKPLCRAVIIPSTRSIYSLSVQRRHDGARCFGLKCKRSHRHVSVSACLLLILWWSHGQLFFCSCRFKGLQWGAEERLKGERVTKVNFKPFPLPKTFMFVFQQKLMHCVNVVSYLPVMQFGLASHRSTPSLFCLRQGLQMDKIVPRVWCIFFYHDYLNTLKSTHDLWETALRWTDLKKEHPKTKNFMRQVLCGCRCEICLHHLSLIGHSLYCMQQQPVSPECHILPLVCNSLNSLTNTEERLIQY